MGTFSNLVLSRGGLEKCAILTENWPYLGNSDKFYRIPNRSYIGL